MQSINGGEKKNFWGSRPSFCRAAALESLPQLVLEFARNRFKRVIDALHSGRSAAQIDESPIVCSERLPYQLVFDSAQQMAVASFAFQIAHVRVIG